MTGTSLNLGGFPDEFLGGYLKSIGSSLGLSTSPSTANITIYEDEIENKFFAPIEVGKYTTVTAGSNWSFGGVITRYEVDVRNIGGRGIRITMADPREIMKSIPVIMAPGYQVIASEIANTECSVLDVYGSLNAQGINVSNWNQSGMPYDNFEAALHGRDNIYPGYEIPVERQLGKAFGELYEFDISEVTARVQPDYRINTNLVPISNIIQDLSNHYSFDWFVTSERLTSGIIKVTIKTIDRSIDNIDISLPQFLAEHEDRVITATSGVELRNEVACSVLQGALVEQLTKVNIKGMANEPLDLSAEGGTNAYNMVESEIRAVLAGKVQWRMWLGQQRDLFDIQDEDREILGPDVINEDGPVEDEDDGPSEATNDGNGFSRYGGNLTDDDCNELVRLATINQINSSSLPKNKKLVYTNLVGDRAEICGKIFTKLSNHAKATYGKRWVHDDILDDIIQSAWTRDVVAKGDSGGALKNADPNEYFRQKDGRTRAYVEYSLDAVGGAFSLGLANLSNLFGNQNIFKDITRFGTTFSNRSSEENSTLVLELKDAFNPALATIDIKDTANYVYKESSSLISSVKTSLYVAASVSNDGVVTIPGGVFESNPTRAELVTLAFNIAAQNGGKTTKEGDKVTTQEELQKIIENRLYRFYGKNIFEMHMKSYQPDFAYIPTRSKFTRYGPIFSDALGGGAQGRLNIITDDGFSPWEFGSISFMVAAMQLKVNNATSLQKEAFSASIQVEGYPIYGLGESLEKNSNINSISIAFGDGGVKTSYSLQTYTRKFGEMSKEDWARLAFIVSNGGGRILPQQQASYTSNYNVNVAKQYTSGFNISSGGNNGGALDFG